FVLSLLVTYRPLPKKTQMLCCSSELISAAAVTGPIGQTSARHGESPGAVVKLLTRIVGACAPGSPHWSGSGSPRFVVSLYIAPFQVGEAPPQGLVTAALQ